MTGADVWSASAASIASAVVGMRAHMLRPLQSTWTQAPRPVWVGLTLLALGLAMSAVSIWFGAPSCPREATVYTLLALAGGVMLWNLNRHGRAAEVERDRIAAQVRAALEASGPIARYPLERSNG